MRIHKANLLMSMRVLISAVAFLITIMVGGFTNADPARFLFASIFIYVFFFILTGIFIRILDRLHEEVDVRPGTSEEVNVRESGTGNIIDMMQNAEMPFEP